MLLDRRLDVLLGMASASEAVDQLTALEDEQRRDPPVRPKARHPEPERPAQNGKDEDGIGEQIARGLAPPDGNKRGAESRTGGTSLEQQNEIGASCIIGACADDARLWSGQ